MTYIEQLRADIEAAAEQLGIKPSTLGEKAGQGGQFYKRLVEGKQVWPQTAENVRKSISALLNEQAIKSNDCDVSHVSASAQIQGEGADKSPQGASQ